MHVHTHDSNALVIKYKLKCLLQNIDKTLDFYAL